MSYAVASTHNTKGVRTLGAATAPLTMRPRRQTGGYLVLGNMGDASDTASGMISEGYDPSVVATLLAAGASDAQMQGLWDNTAPGSSDFALGANQLLTQLTGGAGGASSAPGFPQNLQNATVSTAFGVYDLTQEASWNTINNIFVQVANELNQVATKFPGDADTASKIQQFNSTVMQWAGYYQQMFGYAPSPLPLASTTGTPGLSGLGVFPVVAVLAIAAAIVAALAAAYAYHQWAQAKLAATTVMQTQANTQQTTAAAATAQANQLLAQAAAAQASGNGTLATQLRAQALQLQSQAATVSGTANATAMAIGSFLQTNWWIFAVGLGALIIVPNVLAPPRRRR